MEENKKEIDGTVYIVTQMDALSALKIQAKLVKVIGPALGQLKGSDLKKETIKERMTSAVLSLAEKLDDDVVVDLVVSLFAKNVNYEHTDGKPVKVSFESHFTGKIATMWKVALYVLEVNFGDLLGKFQSSSLTTEELKADKKEN